MKLNGALAIAALLLASCSTTAPSGSLPAASSTGTPTTTESEPTPTAKPQTLDIAWSEVDFEGSVGAVIGDKGQFVAVSADPSDRVAWTSADGESWVTEPVPNPAPTGCNFPEQTECFPNSAGMGQLVRLSDTLYSVGTTASFNDFLQPVGWRLTDGQDWAPIHSESDFYSYGHLLDLAASDRVLVASKLGGFQFLSTVWRWTLDSSWDESNLSASANAPLEVRDVAWGEDTFVAVGVIAEPVEDAPYEDWPATAATWVSTDGLAWTRATAPDAATGLCSVASTSLGFVALGATETGPAAWVSQDVESWMRSELSVPDGATADLDWLFPACTVVELDDGLLAIRPADEGTLTWTSVDGVTWQEGPLLEVGTEPDLVAAVGNTVVLFGRSLNPQSDGGPQPSVLLVGTVEP